MYRVDFSERTTTLESVNPRMVSITSAFSAFEACSYALRRLINIPATTTTIATIPSTSATIEAIGDVGALLEELCLSSLEATSRLDRSSRVRFVFWATVVELLDVAPVRVVL